MEIKQNAFQKNSPIAEQMMGPSKGHRAQSVWSSLYPHLYSESSRLATMDPVKGKL